MKRRILWLMIAALTLGVCADPVSSEMAVSAANAWAQKNGKFQAGAYATGDVHTETDPANDCVLWHQVAMSGGGMLVVAPVTEIEPIIMALDSNPGVLSADHTLRAILTADLRRRLQFLGLYPEPEPKPAGGISLMSAAPDTPVEVSDIAKSWGDANKSKWERMVRKPGIMMLAASNLGLETVNIEISVIKGFEKGGVLTHWNQGSYNDKPLFNLYTPGKAVCGCVATACAALVQFYNATNAAEYTSICSYKGDWKEYTTKPGAIDWGILPSNWGGTNAAITADAPLSAEQQDLIGRVAYNAGVGVSMEWNDWGSGACSEGIVTALKDVFGFKHARCVYFDDMFYPDQEQLEKLLYNQVRAGVPVIMGIDGHEIVATGYGLDADNIERVRLFMGWSGAGDGWYALPKIDTQSVPGGAMYLSEIVSEVVTMVAYDNDDIVPVVGRVTMPGAKLEIAALNREIDSDGYGYFGTRVPANLPSSECVITCMGKEAQFTIGAAAAYSEDAMSLTMALPDAFEFSLLNSSVAYSLERAKYYAEREGKAVLRVSGRSTDTNTATVLNCIYNLDKDNVNDFTNKFVYVFSSVGSRSGDGADLSYGVYLPSKLDPDERWKASNGALAYGYLTVNSLAANDTHTPGHEVLGGATTNAYTYTFAPVDAASVVETNEVYDVDAICASVETSFLSVLDAGGRRHAECTSGIVLTIEATSDEAEDAINADEASDPCGVYEECIAPGTATYICNAEVTNETAGVVFGCAGWLVRNETTGAITIGEGTVATFPVEENDEITLTWDLSRVVAVHAKVTWNDPGSINDDNTVTPGSGWYPAGVPQVFKAKPTVGRWYLQYIKQSLHPEGTIELSPLSILVPMDAPCRVEASYRKATSVAKAEEAAPSEDDVLPPPPTSFDIDWDANLSVLNSTNYSSNLISKAQMDRYGINAGDVRVNVPRGFKPKLSRNSDGDLVVSLNLDEEVLKPVPADGMPAPITIFPNGDGTLTVKSDVKGVRGFWYTLYASNNLSDWSPVKSGYVEGTPSDQAAFNDAVVSVWIKVDTENVKMFFKLVVTDERP